MIHYRCKDCEDVDMVYVECVRIDWNAHEQDWDIDPNGKNLNQRCSNCHSWNIEEYHDECDRCGKSMESQVNDGTVEPGNFVCTTCSFEIERHEEGQE